jgi:hypothetical protein
MSQKSTRYFITYNHGQNPEEIAEARKYILRIYESWKKKSKLCACCFEKGRKSGRVHAHMYVRFRNGRSWSAIKKEIAGADIQLAKGSDEQIMQYLEKGGDCFENGHRAEQGRRRDLERLVNDIRGGKKGVEEILLEDAFAYHVFGRTLEKIENVVKRSCRRTTHTAGKWLYGETGVGKSRYAFAEYERANCYVKCLEPGDVRWWDGYRGERTVILDEYRGEFSFAFLLKLMDRHPLYVPRRNKEPVPFTSKRVIITSCYHPHYIYKDETKKTMEQLKRRCEIIKLFGVPSSLIAVDYRPIYRDKPRFTIF